MNEIPHPDGPHTHTWEFNDNDGNPHTFTHDCPGVTVGVMRDLLASTGADSVNALTVDGVTTDFDQTVNLLMQLGEQQKLGATYRTDENILRMLMMIAGGMPE
jgi:hypothetical protein